MTISAPRLPFPTATAEEVDFVIEARLRDVKHLRTFLDQYEDVSRSGLLLHGGDSLEWIAPNVLAAPWWMVI